MIYNALVPMTSDDPANRRARILYLDESDARVNVTLDKLGVDAFIFQMGGSQKVVVDQHLLYEDSTWPIRQPLAEALGIPVIGRFDVSPEWYLFFEADYNITEGESNAQNRVLTRLLQSWYKGTWDWNNVQTPYDPTKWRKLAGLMIAIMKTTIWGGVGITGKEAGDAWVTLSISHVMEKLKVLMDEGKIPTVPLILHTTPFIVGAYLGVNSQLANYLGNLNRQKWLWLSYQQWTLYKGVTDISELINAWQWAGVTITTTFRFAYTPDGMDKRVLFHEWSGDRMYVNDILTSGGLAARPVTVSLANDTAAVLLTILKTYSSDDGNPPDGTDPTTIEKKLDEMAITLASMQLALSRIQETLDPLGAGLSALSGQLTHLQSNADAQNAGLLDVKAILQKFWDWLTSFSR